MWPYFLVQQSMFVELDAQLATLSLLRRAARFLRLYVPPSLVQFRMLSDSAVLPPYPHPLPPMIHVVILVSHGPCVL